MIFSLVVAIDQANGIGKNNTMVWNLPTDLKHFASVTKQTQDPTKLNAVIMGRNTWESLPANHRPLKGRVNIVLSRSDELQLPPGVLHARSIDEALQKIDTIKNIESAHVIGGAKVFEEAINHPKCTKIYLTRLAQTFECDAFFPPIPFENFKVTTSSGTQQENGIDFEFLTYERIA